MSVKDTKREPGPDYYNYLVRDQTSEGKMLRKCKYQGRSNIDIGARVAAAAWTPLTGTFMFSDGA